MNITPLDARRTGTVSERLTARLDEIDPVIGRLLKNEAKLIADALVTARHQAEIWEQLTEMRDELATENRKLRLSVNTTQALLAEFYERTFWQRLRWLVTGR